MPDFGQKVFDKDVVGDLYADGNGGIKISKKLGISIRQVYNILDDLNVVRKKNGWHARKYKLNELFFDELTPTTCYWLGLLCADGDIHRSKVRLGFKIDDIEHLRKFALVLKSNYEPRIEHRRSGYPGKPYARIYIGSSYMVDTLKSLGFCDFKNGMIEPMQQLDDKLFWHWLRGFSDGDGTVSWRTPKNRIPYPVWSLVSPHKRVLAYIGCRISKIARVTILNVYKSKTIYNIKAERRKAETILYNLYDNCYDDRLDRKFQSYQYMVEGY